jgi:hypothetical protein
MKAVATIRSRLLRLELKLLKRDFAVLGSRWIESRRNCAAMPPGQETAAGKAVPFVARNQAHFSEEIVSVSGGKRSALFT